MIKRYDPTTVYIGCGEYVGDVEETEDGDYALFDDHRAIVERLRRDNEMACENTPWPGCECPGCETARERAAQADLVASYEAELEEDRQAERDRILGARVREIASQHDARLDPYGFARAVVRAMEEVDDAI